MKKILLYIDTLGRGGAERVLTNLANEFTKNGYQVVFVIVEKVENEYPLDDRIKKIYFSSRSKKLNFFIYVFNYLMNSVALYRVIRKEKPDVALSFLGVCNMELLLFRPFFKSTKAYISVRNIPDYEHVTDNHIRLARWLFPKADGVIVQTTEIEKWYYDRGINIKSRIIPNQVDYSFFDYPVAKEHKHIVSVGRLDSQKNRELLIRAYAKICDEFEDNLYIYGKGPLKEELQSLINELHLENRVFLKGAVSDVPEHINDSKLFVLSSEFEGMPNALLEALALGLVCISTDCAGGGPKDIINDGVNGFLTPVGDVDAMADKMRYVLSMPDEQYLAISNNARESAKAYKPDKVYKMWENYLFG